jgi:hypothetical protein
VDSDKATLDLPAEGKRCYYFKGWRRRCCCCWSSSLFNWYRCQSS